MFLKVLREFINHYKPFLVGQSVGSLLVNFHPLVCRSVGLVVYLKVGLKALYCTFFDRNSYFKCLSKKIVCLSVCLTFFESADARDLGLITLF